MVTLYMYIWLFRAERQQVLSIRRYSELRNGLSDPKRLLSASLPLRVMPKLAMRCPWKCQLSTKLITAILMFKIFRVYHTHKNNNDLDMKNFFEKILTQIFLKINYGSSWKSHELRGWSTRTISNVLVGAHSKHIHVYVHVHVVVHL